MNRMKWHQLLATFVIVLKLVVRCGAICNNAELTDDYGTLDSSVFMSQPLEGGEECQFKIEPSEMTSSVLLIFDELSIITAELFVYQGNSASSDNLLWSCTRCGSVLPPPLLSEEGGAYMTFRSPNSEISNFRIRYLSYSDNLNGGRRSLSMLMSLGWLALPRTANGKHPPKNFEMKWTIGPLDCDDCQLTLMLEELALASGDEMRVYEGTTEDDDALLAFYSDTSEEPSSWIEAVGSSMLVILETGSLAAVQNSTFVARYYADASACNEGDYCDCGEAGAPAHIPVLSGPTMRLADGSASSAAMEVDACYWLIEPKVLSSSAADMIWPPRADQKWRPRLTLVMEHVSIKRTGGILRVYDGGDTSATLLWNCDGCQEVVPPPLEASGFQLFVEYESDTSSPYYQDPLNPSGTLLEWTGWKALYIADGHEVAAGSGSGVVPLLAGSADSVRSPDAAVSQNQPPKYSASLDYRWVLTPSPTGSDSSLRIVFNRLALSNCSSDELLVYDGAVSHNAAYAGNWDSAYADAGSPALLRSYNCDNVEEAKNWIVARATDGVTIRLRSGEQHRDTQGLIDFAYYSDAPKYKCGHAREPGLLTATSFLFSDGSEAAEAMDPALDCQWLLAPTPNVSFGNAYNHVSNISLVFTRLDMTGAELRLYDGEDETAPLLWSCSECDLMPAGITSTSEYMLLTLTTSASGSHGTGFEARYYASYPDGNGMGDGTVPLFAAASTAVYAPTALGRLPANLDHFWRIDVGDTDQGVTLAFAELDFGDENDCAGANLTVYDGTAAHDSDILGVFCGDILPTSWLVSSGPTLTFRLRTDARGAHGTGFEVAYFSEQAQLGCGGSFGSTLDSVPYAPNYGAADRLTRSVLRAPSFLFSDGSASSEQMRSGEFCDWIIAPTGEVRQIVLQFPRMELTGAEINVTDASSNRLLWRCRGALCNAPPESLVLACDENRTDACAMRVAFASDDDTSSEKGSGFLAHYAVTTTPPLEVIMRSNSLSESSILLATPGALTKKVVPDSEPGAVWFLSMPSRPIGASSWKLQFDDNVGGLVPLVNATSLGSGLSPVPPFSPIHIVDGNDAVPQPGLATTLPSHCGMLTGVPTVADENNSITLRGESQDEWSELPLMPSTSASFFQTTANKGHRVRVYNVTSSQSNVSVALGQECAWTLSPSESLGAEYARLTLLEDVKLPEHAVIEVRAGSSAHGELLESCTGCEGNTMCCPTLSRGNSITAWCGQLFVHVYANKTIGSQNRVPLQLNETQLRLVFELGKPLDSARAPHRFCFDDSRFQPSVDEETGDTTTVLEYLILATMTFLVLLGLTVFGVYIRRLEKKRRGDFALGYESNTETEGRPSIFNRRRTNALAAAPHIKHARYYHQLLHNVYTSLTLRRSSCSICYSESIKCFRLNGCQHSVCRPCLQMYAQAALGDISIFPVRCPMHHAGCKTTITDAQVRFVLSRSEYSKFIDFLDRTIFGDGVNCLKCGCFVNLPTDSSDPAVQCPYCAYRWCTRCKCPWHQGFSCQDRDDVELEEWRENQGATRCPGCYKIIEKDDPETCNHMVHKSTDAMPCTRTRTDFCYCCGIEVTTDYPHMEVDNPDVVHFPDGVFQDCRAVKEGCATGIQRRRHRRQNSRTRQQAGDEEANLTLAAGDNAFGNFFQTPPRLNQIAPAQEPAPIAIDTAGYVSPTEQRRRRREQRESEARAAVRLPVLGADTNMGGGVRTPNNNRNSYSSTPATRRTSTNRSSSGMRTPNNRNSISSTPATRRNNTPTNNGSGGMRTPNNRNSSTPTNMNNDGLILLDAIE